MKCTNKKSKLSVKARKKQKQRLKRTLILSSFLAVLLLGGVVTIFLLRSQKQLNIVLPFELETEVFGMIPDESTQVAEGFAHDLCVGEADTALDGIECKNNERAALFNVKSQDVMFSREMYTKSFPASITKIMTAIVALKYGNMEDIVTVSKNAVTLEEGSQNIGFVPGDKISMDELFHSLLIYSGNDAAMAIAEHMGNGNVTDFVALMNEEAAALGATGTHFTNPHGLQDENHYTTVYDIYLMLNEAIKYKEFVTITQMHSYSITYMDPSGKEVKKLLESTDKYLTGEIIPPKGVTIIGGKTGTTSKAGACLAVVTQNAYGDPYISIVLNAKTKTNLYERMNELLGKINS